MSNKQQQISGQARAKLNLFLHVTGKRADGYHLLESFITFVGLADTVSIKAANHLSLDISGPYATPAGLSDDNLVLRAARALALHAGISLGCHIELVKYIPVGAGLGGGSADAACTLHLLNELWNLHLPLEILQQIGLTLGADVPVCLLNKPAFVSGIGDIITPVEVPIYPILLVNPGKSLATKDVFGRGFKQFSASQPISTDFFDKRNDLEPNAVALLPDIAEILAAIKQLPGCLVSRMSGSGATCFGVFENEVSLASAHSKLASHHPEWWIWSKACD